MYATTASYNCYLTQFLLLPIILHIYSMIIQNTTISIALTYTQGQTSKKAHKILISQKALKLQS